MNARNMLVAVGLILSAPLAGAAPLAGCTAKPDSLVCKQQEDIERIWVDMNQSVDFVVDDVMAIPTKAVDAGCLDELRKFDLSIITVDPYSIWSDIYADIKDKLLSLSCTAVEDGIRKQTEKLKGKLEAPYGLGSVSLREGSYINSLEDVSHTRVILSNEAAKRKVVDEVFRGKTVPEVKRFTERKMSADFLEKNGTIKRIEKRERQETIEDTIDFDRLWKKEAATK
jgi:hypothetical protein